MEAPHNLSAEAGVLGAILYDNAAFYRVRDVLHGECFYSLAHRAVWEAIETHIREGRVADGVTLREWFEGESRLKEIGGAAYLGDLLDQCAFGPEIIDYAGMVASLWKRRSLASLGGELSKAAMNSGDPDKLLGEHEAALEELQKHSGAVVETHDAGASLLMALESQKDRASRFVKTGLPSLDRKLGGLMKGAIHVLAARPSMGKTTLATVIGHEMAEAGAPVGFFSLEMPRESLATRKACYEAWKRGRRIRYFDVEQNQARPEDLEFLAGGVDALSAKRFMIDDRMGLCPQQMAAAIRSMNMRSKRAGHGPLQVIFVDHIGHLKPDEGRRNRYEDTGNVSKALLEIAKRFDLAVVVMVQLNRASQAEKRKPLLHDLRNSGEIEEDAHSVIFLHREDYYLERAQSEGTPEEQADASRKLTAVRGQAEIIIAKNRNGPVGTELFTHSMDNNVIRERGNVERAS